MTVRKISESDKLDILNFYRTSGATTSTLADQYGVSNSTISRLLKSTLSEEEYEELIASKRAARTPHTDATQKQQLNPPYEASVTEPLIEVETNSEAEPNPAYPRLRRRSSTALELEKTSASQEAQIHFDTNATEDAPSKYPRQLDIQPLKIAPVLPNLINRDASSQQGQLDLDHAVAGSNSSQLDEDSGAQATAVAQMLGEDLLDESEDLMDLDDEDLDDLDEESDEEPFLVRKPMRSEALVQVLPLSEATLPKTCYLVIDRTSELITRPLRDFGDLGQIPAQEVQQKTLPVFDNHRVARRFSTKRDRVIKIPDSRLLQKTRSHLQAKGITRLLVDGQVYSLSK